MEQMQMEIISPSLISQNCDLFVSSNIFVVTQLANTDNRNAGCKHGFNGAFYCLIRQQRHNFGHRPESEANFFFNSCILSGVSCCWLVCLEAVLALSLSWELACPTWRNLNILFTSNQSAIVNKAEVTDDVNCTITAIKVYLAQYNVFLFVCYDAALCFQC